MGLVSGNGNAISSGSGGTVSSGSGGGGGGDGAVRANRAAERNRLQAAQAQQQRLVEAQRRNALNPIGITMGTETNGYGVNGQPKSVNGVPVTDQSIYGGQQTNMSEAEAMLLGQDFRPRMPNTASGWLAAASNPLSIFGKAFADETQLGLSTPNFDKLQMWRNSDPASGAAPAGFNSMTPVQQATLT